MKTNRLKDKKQVPIDIIIDFIKEKIRLCLCLRSRLRYVFIFIFLLSFSLLFLKEGPLSHTTPGYSSLIPPDLLIDDAWYGVYFQSSFMGYTHYFMKIRDIKEGGGYVLKNNAHLKFPLMGKLEPIDIDMEARLRSNYSLKEGEFKVHSRNYFFSAFLESKGSDNYELTIETPSEKETRMIKRKNEIINLMLSPVSLRYVPLKKKITYNFYDPILNKKVKVVLKNRGKQNIKLKGQDTEAYKIDMDVEGVKGKLFVDDKGRLLKEELLGFTFVKEDSKDLFDKDILPAEVDLINYYSIPSIKLPDKEGLTYMKARIEGVPDEYIQEDHNQKVTPLGKDYIVEINRKDPKEIVPLQVNSQMNRVHLNFKQKIFYFK